MISISSNISNQDWKPNVLILMQLHLDFFKLLHMKSTIYCRYVNRCGARSLSRIRIPLGVCLKGSFLGLVSSPPDLKCEILEHLCCGERLWPLCLHVAKVESH